MFMAALAWESATRVTVTALIVAIIIIMAERRVGWASAICLVVAALFGVLAFSLAGGPQP
jgi:hypothetical protein